jgi:hypothetical protein
MKVCPIALVVNTKYTKILTCCRKEKEGNEYKAQEEYIGMVE